MGITIKKNILLTGGSGKLGSAIIISGSRYNIMAPSESDLDIRDREKIRHMLNEKDIDIIIHCAAIARMSICEDNPFLAVETNIYGTVNLVLEVLEYEKRKKNELRFIYISTDAVYHGVEGDYSETEGAYPYNIYGWTKLGAESAVKTLKNHCIIRTRFFDPENIQFEDSPIDLYTSKVSVKYLVEAVFFLVEHSFKGIINVGGKKGSEYEINKSYKPSIKPCKRQEIASLLNYTIAKDASLNNERWNSLINGSKIVPFEFFDLDILIPVYNEAENIKKVLEALAKNVKTPFRILICYDHDEDNTLPIVRNMADYPAKIVEVKNRRNGILGAVLTGFEFSSAKAVVVYPADDVLNSVILDNMYMKFLEGSDIVAASRFMKGGSMKNCPLLKSILVRTASLTLFWLAFIPIRDASNGFRLFSRRLLDTIEIESTQGFTYSIELLVKCFRFGWKISEVPSHWIERDSGTSRFSIIKWLPYYIKWYLYQFKTMYLRRTAHSVKLKKM